MEMRHLTVFFIVLLVLSAHFADAKRKKRAAAPVHEVALQPCSSNEDCPGAKCQTTACRDGVCVSEKTVCPAPADSCSYSLGCDPATDVCRYSQLVCDDANPCTIDQCVRNSTEQSYCVHTPLAGCDNSAVHAVSFRVENANHLNVQVHGGSAIEFCQSSTLVGTDTSVIIGFDAYTPCKLHERGSCDNKLSVATTPAVVTIVNTYDDGECNVDGGSHAMAIDEVTGSLRWDADATFTPTPLRDGQQIHGYLNDDVNPGLSLRADIVLRPNGAQAVVRELEEECYDSAGIDSTMWSTYDVASGTLAAAHDTQYMGLVYRVVGGYAQVGHGASGRNREWGVYMRLDLELASQPHDDALALNTVQTKALLRSNLEQRNAVPIDYCALFDEPRQETINGWRPTYSTAMHTVTYCRNFTLNEMLKCRAAGDRYATMFKAINADIEDDGHVNFAGTVHQTTVQPRTECSVWNDDTCGERVVSATSYNITVVTNASGVRRVDIVHSDFEFDIRWLENRWMCCGADESGNLRVIVETTVSGEKRKLINPRVNFADETGHPLTFEDEEAPCEAGGDGSVCVQRWSLRTYGGSGVVDFSGVKPLLWDVFERRSIIAHVTATMTLRARHVGSQTHLDDGRVGAQLTFFSDRSLHTRYDADKAPDGTPLFASLCLDRHRHLHLVVNEVTVCYSLKHDLGDGECDKRMVMYSRHGEPVVNASIHAFEFITNPPEGSHCAGFSFLARAYTKYRQVVSVDYSVQEVTGDGGLIELWHDDDDDDDDDWPHHHAISYPYAAYCIHPRTFDWEHHHCHEWHDDDGSVVVFVVVVFAIFLFFGVGCLATSHASRKARKVAKRESYSSDDDNDARPIETRRKTVRTRFVFD